MRRLIASGAVLAATLLTAGPAAAQSGQAMSGEDAIEYRRAVFEVIAGNFKPMGAMVEGKIDYDAERFARNAERVAALSRMALEGFEGGPHAGEDTEALDAIWDQWEKFQQGMQQLQERAQALASAAEGGELSQVRGPFVEVADTCKGCHDNFREE